MVLVVLSRMLLLLNSPPECVCSGIGLAYLSASRARRKAFHCRCGRGLAYTLRTARAFSSSATRHDSQICILKLSWSSFAILQNCLHQAEGIIIPTSFAPINSKAQEVSTAALEYGGQVSIELVKLHSVLRTLRRMDVVSARDLHPATGRSALGSRMGDHAHCAGHAQRK